MKIKKCCVCGRKSDPRTTSSSNNKSYCWNCYQDAIKKPTTIKGNLKPVAIKYQARRCQQKLSMSPYGFMLNNHLNKI